MLLRKWEDLPAFMQNDAISPYYNNLKRRTLALMFKRLFDVVVSAILLVVLLPVMLAIAAIIRSESEGPALFKQERVTAYGKRFQILKFRTMVDNAEKLGPQVTVCDDARITKVGNALRSSRLDELPQLVNILVGDLSFVGTRPDVVKYVERYTDEMNATLLMPAGVTSEASILYKDESRLLSGAENVDEAYVTQVLPKKMIHNLAALQNFGTIRDLKTMARTVFAVFGSQKAVHHLIQTETASVFKERRYDRSDNSRWTPKGRKTRRRDCRYS